MIGKVYKIKLTARAKKELKEISKLYRDAIDAAFIELSEDPFIGKPLTRELLGKFTYKVSIYRLIYKVDRQNKIVYILTAGHRATIYQ